MPLSDATRGNISKLMVRRHLRPWVDRGYPEERLADLFIELSAREPDLTYRQLARVIDHMLTTINSRLQGVETLDPVAIPLLEEPPV